MVERQGALGNVAGLTSIPSASVEFLEHIDFDVFTLGPRGQPILFCSRELRPQLAAWAALREQGEFCLYIKATDRERWRTQFRASVEQLLENDAVPPLRQVELLQALLDESLRGSHESGHVAKTIEQTLHLAPLLTSVLSRGVAAAELFQILRHDFDTFSHVVNVASYCVLLARELGVRDAGELEKVTVGGLLHDIGKRCIPHAVLAKRGPLTPAERELVQRHPQQGYEDLLGRDDLEVGQLLMTYQHHERMDGKGYPVQITGREMHPWARMCAVCDVFEALTGERPYRKAMTLETALAFLREHAGTHFDAEMVACWISAIERVHSTRCGAALPCASS
jgi:HD-GYP domain-containing protein (c-di-GMP phosphodiesterase class II)